LGASKGTEIIVPIFDGARQTVIGTIDVESELRDAFSPEGAVAIWSGARM